jgi:site-specific recombinase XerD
MVGFDMDHDSAPDPDPAASPALPGPLVDPAESDYRTLHTDLLGDLEVPGGAGRGAELEALAARAAIYATRARGDGTRRVYRSAWRGYEAWCRSLGREPLSGDPDLLAMYATRRADDGVAVSTLRVDLAAIRTAHLLAGVPLDMRHPRLAMVVEGITRGRGTRPVRQAAPAVPDVLRQLLGACQAPGTALGARDRAMLLLGFGAALRRSELVALQLGDVATVPGRGLRLLVRRSKTDQHGQGQDIAIWANPAEPLLCPLAAMDAWLALRHQARDLDWSAAESARRERPLFCAVTKAGRPTGVGLSDKAVARLVKGTALRAGLDPERYSGHSLRAGLATAAGDAGAALRDLMRQTRHKGTQVALAYLRPADLWRNNVTQGVFATKGEPES